MKRLYKRLVLMCTGLVLSASMYAQTTISGKITDTETGEALIGATVRIQATSDGEITDIDGNYALTSSSPLPWNIIVSYSGYTPKRVEVTSSGQTINVQLKSGTVLEDVTVTAQKRPQNPIEVPIAMSVVTGESIAKEGISNMTEMAVKIPNVDINTGFAAPTLSIRGITSSGTNAGFDQSVATFIDGFYAGKPQMVLSPFLDVQQVEVLKGPQPTFFGQSAIAGALSVVTQKPDEDGDGFANVSFGSQTEYNVEAGYTIRPSDQFGVRVAGKYNNFDGFLEETTTGELFGGFQQYAGRLTAEWKPSDIFDATVKVEINDRIGDGTGIMRNRDSQYNAGDVAPFPAAFVEGSMGAALAFNGSDPAYQEYDASAEEFIVNVGGDQPLPAAGAVMWDLSAVGGPPTPIPTTDLSTSAIMRQTGENDGNQDVSSEVYQLNMNLKLGEYTLQSITASGGFESSTWLDVDMSRYALFHVNGVADYNQFSQELRLISPDNSKFNWMVGSYYQTNDWTQDNRVHSAVIGTTGARLVEDSEWLSFFGSFSYNVTSKLFLEAGARYSDVTKNGDLNSIAGFVDATTTANAAAIAAETPFTWEVNAASSANLFDQTYSTNAFDPSISFVWKDVRTTYYAKYAKGFKAGGFNVGNNIDVNNPTFDDETANSIEIGVKGVSDDFKFRYNIALFNTNYEDLQISAFDNQTSAFIVTNAGTAITQGIELDGSLYISDRFTLNADLAFTNAEFDDYITGPNSDEAASGENIETINGVTVVNRSGYELKFSPDYQFTIRPEFTFPLTSGDNVNFNINFSYRDDYQTGDNYYNSDQQDAHELLDLNLGYTKKDNSWGVSLYGRNITNRYYLTVSNDSTVIPGRNARFGVQARIKF